MSSSQSKAQRIRYDIKIRRIRVCAIEALSPSLRAISFTGEDLADFQSDGFDDHIKVFFPHPDTGELVLPQLGERGIEFPEGVTKPDVREYTPTGIDTANQTLVLEFAMHDAGPATTWAKQAKIGDELGIAGPRSALVLPLDNAHHILIGDETALPAIRRRLQQLPDNKQAYVVAEVDAPTDAVALPSAAHVEAHWAYRFGQAVCSEHFMLQLLSQLALPKDDTLVWIACEREQARALRAWFLAQGYDKDCVKASSYWNRGTAAYHEPHED